MSDSLLVATNNGLLICERGNGAWRIETRVLSGRGITGVVAREGVILAGTREGVMRSDDRGKTWDDASAGLTNRYVRWLAFHPDISNREFVGTEPANIFVSHDGAESWRECGEVAQLRDVHKWYLPYSKGAGCIRGFAFNGPHAYAAVEVGGALRSDDTGETWRLCDGSDGNPDLAGPPEPLIYPDVHSVAVHPSSPDLVFAPTGGGFYVSRDGGATWRLAYDGYARAVWSDPLDAAHLIMGIADGVDSNGRIEQSRDGGATWQDASRGLATPWRRHMVERFSPIGPELFAVLSNGELIAARVDEWRWQRVLPDVQDANAVTEML